jgi:hypothetical protein
MENMDECKEKQTCRILLTTMNMLYNSFKPLLCEVGNYSVYFCPGFIP